MEGALPDLALTLKEAQPDELAELIMPAAIEKWPAAPSAVDVEDFDTDRPLETSPQLDRDPPSSDNPAPDDHVAQGLQEASVPAAMMAMADEPIIPSAENATHEEIDAFDGAIVLPAPVPIPAIATPKAPSKYQPRLQPRVTPDASRPARAAPDQPATRSTRTLDAEMALTFGAGGWGAKVSIVLRNGSDLGEEISARYKNGVLRLAAIGDDFFEPFEADDPASALLDGVAVESNQEGNVRWVRGGRPLHVFSTGGSVAGFISATRIVIGVENALLFVDRMMHEVLECIAASGSCTPVEISGPGIPPGWRCFRNIRPIRTLSSLPANSALLPLSPLPDAAIGFDGGIAMGPFTWLTGFPPSIRIIGGVPDAGAVLIDAQPACLVEDGWQAQGWDAEGDHVVNYLGISRAYELRAAPEIFEGWAAHGSLSSSICGAMVSGPKGRDVIALEEGASVIGARPGEIAETRHVDGSSAVIAVVDFAPVWVISGRIGRRLSRVAPRMIGEHLPPLPVADGTPKRRVQSWCAAVRSIARDIEWPGSLTGAEDLWLLYAETARRLGRRSK